MKKTYHKIMTFLFRSLKSPPYSRNYYYENLLMEHNRGSLYFILMKDLKNTNGIETNTEIQFMDNKKNNEINKECIIRKYGIPSYKFIYEPLPEIEVLFYRQKLGSHKTKLELHFFKNKLFLYTYTFSHLSLKDKNEIIKIIKEKYLERECKDIINYNIVDKNKNIIMLNDGVDFSIKYSRKNNIDLETILKNNEFQNSKEENKRKRDKKILFKRL